MCVKTASPIDLPNNEKALLLITTASWQSFGNRWVLVTRATNSPCDWTSGLFMRRLQPVSLDLLGITAQILYVSLHGRLKGCGLTDVRDAVHVQLSSYAHRGVLVGVLSGCDACGPALLIRSAVPATLRRTLPVTTLIKTSC